MNVQMFLALGAMILLSLIIITTNKNSLYTEDVLYDSNFGILATSLGASYIEDASKKHFDHISDTIAISNLSMLTTSANLGPDGGENNTTLFNDVDDYNNYSTVDSSMPSAVFNVSCKVDYVNPSNPDTSINSSSWHKKITVKVWSISMKDTIVQSSIFSYWNFN